MSPRRNAGELSLGFPTRVVRLQLVSRLPARLNKVGGQLAAALRRRDKKKGRGAMLAKSSVAAGVFIGAIGLAGLMATGAGRPAQAATSNKPNIIFVVLDDVGIDQLNLPPFINNGGVAPPKTPNMELIAKHG